MNSIRLSNAGMFLASVLLLGGCWPDTSPRDSVLSGQDAAAALRGMFDPGWNYRPLDFVSVAQVTAHKRDSLDAVQWWFEVVIDPVDAGRIEGLLHGSTKRMCDNDDAIVTCEDFHVGSPLPMETPPSGWSVSGIAAPARQFTQKWRASNDRDIFPQSTVFVFSPNDRRVFIVRRQL